MEWRNVTVKLGDLQPWEHNPRTMTKRQAQRLLKSWKELGQFQTIAIGPHGEVYDGHQRLNALLTAHDPSFEIEARQSERELNDDERAALTLAANLPAGAWDWNKLAQWDAGAIAEWGMDAETLATWNSDAANLATMLQAETPTGDADAEPQIDRTEELNKKWQVKPGDLWRIGEHRLLCGDSEQGLDRIRGNYVITAVIADPPYGINIVKGFSATDGAKPFGRVRQPGGRQPPSGKVGGPGVVEPRLYRAIEGDDKPFDPAWLISLAKVVILFGANHFASRLPDSPAWIVWEKYVSDQSTFSACELAWSNVGNHVKRYEWTWSGMVRAGDREVEMKDRIHPTQKPVGLIEKIIQDYTDERAVILEPYLGSGTTMLAAARTNRICVGGELDEAYCAVILERMETAFPGIEIERI